MRLNLPGVTVFIGIIPILPIYIISIICIGYKSPTRVASYRWINLFSFILLIPLLIYCFHLIGKRIFSKINIMDDDNHGLYLNTINYDRNKPERNKNNFYKKLLLLWIVSIFFYFLTLYSSKLGYDTPSYLTFVKDFFESGDLDLILNPTLKSKPNRGYNIRINISYLIPVLLLIFFTIICGGDIFLGAVVLTTLLFCIGPPLIALITKNLTESSSIAIWAGILYFLFANILLGLTGIFKQQITVDLILISLYLITKKYKSKTKKKISTLLVIFIIIIQSFLYNLLFGISYLILTQYFLRKKTVNFGILKNPESYKRIKLLTIFSFGGFLFLIFFNGYISPIIALFFDTNFGLFPEETVFFFQFSISNILNSAIILLQLGIISIFTIIGIYIDYNKKVIKNFKMRTFLIIFLECNIIFLFINLFSFQFHPKRFILFIPIEMSIFGAIGIVELKRIFPTILKKAPKFQRVVEFSLISTLLMSCFLTTTHVRNGYTHQQELDAIDWFKTRADYEKLTNKNTTDIQIISNNHLRWWIQYRIHYNAYSENTPFDHLTSLKVGKDTEDLKKKAHEKLYIFISKNSEQFGEDFTIRELIKFFNEYREDYPFIWTEYKINDLVIIWEIEYI